MNNKTELKEKEFYEAPSILDIKPVSTVHVTGESEFPDDLNYDKLSSE